MPLLNRNGELVNSNVIADGAFDAGGNSILPCATWRADSGAALALSVDDEPCMEFAAAPLITIDFPAFNDGRGLSLAVLLRTRFGFTGELRAVGDVHPDLLHYLQRCGFDTFDLPEHRIGPAADQLRSLAPYSDYYQASVQQPEPAFRRVARGI